MAMQRANPLPIGRYEVSVFPKDYDSFRGWLEEHASTVRVEKEDMHIIDGYIWWQFYVTAPTEWKGPGFPDISTDPAPPPVPLPPPPFEQAEQAAKDAAQAAEDAAKDVAHAVVDPTADAIKQGLTLAVAGGALYVLYKVLT